MDSDSWPYLQNNHGTESDEHRQLKNLAIYYLLQRGFELKDIEDERPLDDSFEGRGVTDIYADNGDVTIFVECKYPRANEYNVGAAGKVAARNGECVLVFDSNGVYRFELVEVEVQSKPIDEVVPPVIKGPDTIEKLKLNYLSELPLLDLRAYK